jgi:hypothetical protein
MKNIIHDIQLIKQFATPLRGVFLISDLIQLMADPHKTAVYRRIAALEEAGLLVRFIKGVYVSDDVDLATLNQKICSESYVSFGTVLAEHQIIAAQPLQELDAVKPGKTRIHETRPLRIRQFGVAPHLMFGFEHAQGINRATPEKALLDTFYFQLHGASFSFDLKKDIRWRRVDRDILHVYLQEYRNPKFVVYVEGLMKSSGLA